MHFFHLVSILVLPGKVLCAPAELSEVAGDSSDENQHFVGDVHSFGIKSDDSGRGAIVPINCPVPKKEVQGWEEKATNNFGGRNVF